MGRIVLFGATGYTGRITAEAMVRAGLRPVLAGRSRERLLALAADLAGAAGGREPLPIAVADVGEPRSVRALLDSSDDVLVSTVGPFSRWGAPAVEAAVAEGAAYVDSTGEPPFIRQVFEEYGPAAERSGARLLTACGYDYVPGNLAGALALREAREAGRSARRVEVGYFVTGGMQASSGTRATTAEMLVAPSMRFRHGALSTAATGAQVRTFEVAPGRRWDALAVGGSEHLTLPRLEPQLREVGTYLGWARRWTRAVAAGSTLLNAVGRIPGARRGLSAAARRLLGESDGSGPAAERNDRGGTVVVACAYDAADRVAARVRVTGPAPYPLTGALLAWAGGRFAAGAAVPVGALGPADAFGLDELVAGCAALGLARDEEAAGPAGMRRGPVRRDRASRWS